ncbi:MAG TPA: laccase domain-containing protein, partial [Solirubrobacteraceae bacterium]|nr:laccase domain-containing protein [Solirubrobacteraceae bacterium]
MSDPTGSVVEMPGERSSLGLSEPASAPIELPGGAWALFTERSHGNLSSVAGPDRYEALSARERLRERCGVQALVRGYQVHGSAVARVFRDGSRHVPGRDDVEVDVCAILDSSQQPRLQVDGHAVAAPGVGAMAMVADCVPVVLAARGAVAALHAGWRGLAGGVLEEGVRALREVGGEPPIVAVVGPCAGGCCYEVGEEVHAAFGAALDGPAAPLDRPDDAASHERGAPLARLRAPIDLRSIAHRRLH